MPEIKKKRAPSVDSDQRAWTQVYDDMNDVINSVNQKSAVESRNGASGLDGDIRLFKDVDKTKYFIEGKFADGWAKRELLFSDSSNETQDESINFSATESYVKPDGTVPFTAKQSGIAPTNAAHLSTKGYTDVGRLVSVTKSGNNLIFGMTDATTNLTFSGFGSNAYNSTTIPTTFVSSLTNEDASGQTLIADSTGSLYRLGGGENITITTDDPGGGQTWVQIDCDINTSTFVTTSARRFGEIRTADHDDAWDEVYPGDRLSSATMDSIIINKDESTVLVEQTSVRVPESGTNYDAIKLNVDLASLPDMTQAWANNTDQFIVLDAGVSKRKQSSEIFGSNAFNSTAFLTAITNSQNSTGVTLISASTGELYRLGGGENITISNEAPPGYGAENWVQIDCDIDTSTFLTTSSARLTQIRTGDHNDAWVDTYTGATISGVAGKAIVYDNDGSNVVLTETSITIPESGTSYPAIRLNASGFLASNHAASGVTATKITNWDNAYGWGNHATENYLKKLEDTAATSGSLPSDHVALIEDYGVSADTAKIYNVASANSNLTIEDAEDGSGNGYIKFTVADQVTSIDRIDQVYAEDEGDTTVTSQAAASGDDILTFKDTDDTTWTISGPTNNRIYASVDIDHPTMYTHPTGAGNKHIPSGGSSGQFLKYDSSGTAVWATPSYTTNTNYYLNGITKNSNTLTFAVNGATDQTYTFGSNAFNSTSFVSNSIYLIEAYQDDAVTTTATASGADKLRFIETDDIEWVISGPSTDVITITPTINFPTMYTHPTGAGNKHIPSGGSSGQFLKYSSSGTATWATPSYTTDTNYYLTGITKNNNTLTFEVSGATDPTYTFGSNAFNSTSFLSNGIYLIEAYETDAVTTTATASGADKLRFIETDDINWAISGPSSDIITITPTINFPTMYTHPTTAGNKHIPAGGASGNFLKYSSDGTAVWATPSYTTNTNYYLDGITKSGNTLTFSVNGATNKTYTFGSNAFNSTSYLTAIASTLTTDENATPPRVSLLDDGSTIKALEEGNGISLEESAVSGGNTVKISSTVDTSGLLTNGIYLIEAYQDDAVTTTATASGADKLRFIETDDIEWAISGPSSDVITITPTINFPTMYTHPTSAGNKHIPSGGSSGQFLKYSSSGTAVWATPSYTTNTNDNYYLTGVTKSNNTLTFTVSGASNPTYTFGSNAFNSTAFLTSHQDISGKANLSHADFSSISLNSHSFPASTGTSSNSWPGLIVGGTTRLVASGADLQVKSFIRICQHLIMHEDDSTNVLNQVGLTYANDNLTVWQASGSGQDNFHVPGDVIAYKSSDPRLKTNKEELENPLYKLSKIKGYRFDWLPEAKKYNSYNEGTDIGVMSNEVEQMYPELVQTRSSGYKAVDYEKLTAVLIAAVNDLTSKLIEKGVLDEELQSSKSCC